MSGVFDVLASAYTKYFAPSAGKRRGQWIGESEAASSDHEPMSHALWTNVLSKHVKQGVIRGITTHVVDYHAAAADEDLKAYLDQLAQADGAALHAHPADRLAFLLNAYNAICLSYCAAAVADGRINTAANPKASINDLGGTMSPVWKKRVGVLAGKKVSLDDIEQKMIRVEFSDPRVHACLNCASASCPNLNLEAFVGDPAVLDQQIEACCDFWVADATKGVLVESEQPLKWRVSRIFSWYANDFLTDLRVGADQEASQAKPVSPGAVSFISRYQERMGDSEPREQQPAVDYFEYDWGLNTALAV